MVIGACFWISKALWNKLGGFPEWFESIGEDLYLCCHARLAGYPVIALGESGYLHKVGMSFGGGKVYKGKLATTLQRRSLSERNKTFVMCICYPTLALAFILPVHLLLLLLEGILLSIINLDSTLFRRVYISIIPSLWKERSRIFKLRRICQNSRNCSMASWLEPFRPFPYKLGMLFKHGTCLR